jgi:glycosyltransferase involved in cell wall biosynthesis
MDILFLSRWFPHPPDNGSKIRISQLLSGLARKHRVTLLSFADDPYSSSDLSRVPRLNQISEVKVLPWRPYHPDSARALIGLLHPTPRSLLDTYSFEMADLIRDSLARKTYDVVIASQLSMATYHACFQGTPAIFEEIELGLFHDQAAFTRGGMKRLRLNLTWFKFKYYFSRLLGSFQAFTVASQREREIFVRHFPAHARKLAVIPNCIDLEDYHGVIAEAKPNRLIFSGSFKYRANYEAMQWFIQEVHPRILDRIPDVELIITGDHGNLPLPPGKNIVLSGHVEDVKPLIASSTVSLAPLWVGGGTRLKIIEAMALGVPVVATSKGSEGLSAVDGEHLLIGDAPGKFAECVLDLLENFRRREYLAVNARRFVEKHFSWSSALPRLAQLVETVARNDPILNWSDNEHKY